jgi:RNA polymerase sigma-70 factor (ECF subfamily)
MSRQAVTLDESDSPTAMADIQRERFHALYRAHFDFVFRNLRRLGVAPAAADDALQEVFMVALRQLDSYEERSHAKAWLFAIALRVARNHHRSARRRGVHVVPPLHGLQAQQPDPFDQASRAQAGRMLHAFLDTLDDDKRAVFVMAELEQMTAPQIARVVSANPNTVYSRLRIAREAFVKWLAVQQKGSGEDHG